jgi:serine phosphatase RsbU (regulator of sigma subunit)/ligand-binding sensor domain-containing protein
MGEKMTYKGLLPIYRIQEIIRRKVLLWYFPGLKKWTQFCIFFMIFECGYAFPFEENTSLKSKFLRQWEHQDYLVTHRDSSELIRNPDNPLATWPDDVAWLAYSDLSQASVFGDSIRDGSDLDFQLSVFVSIEDSLEYAHVAIRVTDDDWLSEPPVITNDTGQSEDWTVTDGCILAVDDSDDFGTKNIYEISGRYPHDHAEKRYEAKATVLRTENQIRYNFKLGPLHTTRRDNRLFYTIRDADRDSSLSLIYGVLRLVPDISEDMLREIEGQVVSSDGSALSTVLQIGHYDSDFFTVKSDQLGQFKLILPINPIDRDGVAFNQYHIKDPDSSWDNSLSFSVSTQDTLLSLPTLEIKSEWPVNDAASNFHDLLYSTTHSKTSLPYTVQHLPVSYEFGNLAVSAIETTKDGFVWIGTDNRGLFRFDGQETVNFNELKGLLSNRVTALNEDQSGRLWVGTSSGLNFVQGDTLIGYGAEEVPDVEWDKRQGTGFQDVAAILSDTDRCIWVASNSGQGILRSICADNLREYQFPPDISNRINTMFVDSNDIVWVGTSEGVYKLTGEKLVEFDPTLRTAINAIHVNETDIYVGTNQGLYCYSDMNPAKRITINGLDDDLITSIENIGPDKLWVGTWDGLALIKESSSYVKIKKKRESTISEVSSTYEFLLTLSDREIQQSLRQIDLSDFIVFLSYTPENVANRFLSNCSLRVRKYIKKEIQDLDEISESEQDRALRAIESIYLSDDTSISKIDIETAQWLLDNRITNLHIDQHNNLWIGSMSGASIAVTSKVREAKGIEAHNDRNSSDIWLHDRISIFPYNSSSEATTYNKGVRVSFTNTLNEFAKDPWGNFWTANLEFGFGDVVKHSNGASEIFPNSRFLGTGSKGSWIYQNHELKLFGNSDTLIFDNIGSGKLPGPWPYSQSIPPLGQITKAATDAQGNLWFASPRRTIELEDGVLKDRSPNRFNVYRCDQSQCQQYADIQSILGKDFDGRVWFTNSASRLIYSDGTGSLFSPIGPNLFTAHHEVAHPIYATANGQVYFLGKNMVRFSDGQLEKVMSASQISHLTKSWPIYQSEYAVSASGLFFFPEWGQDAIFFTNGFENRKLSEHNGLPPQHFGPKRILFDSEGNLLISRGILYPTVILVPTQSQSEASVYLKEIHTDKSLGAKHNVNILWSPFAPNRFTVRYQGILHGHGSEELSYRYKLIGFDSEWKTTAFAEISFADLPSGQYELHVQAIDHFLNPSESLIVNVDISLINEKRAWVGTIILALSTGLIIVFVLNIRGRNTRERLQSELLQQFESELQAAQNIQTDLLPASFPVWENAIVAGQCRPATHVGGDLYHLLEGANNRLASVADVTGHGMEAAVPVMMYDGILRTEIHYDDSGQQLLERLNEHLKGIFGRRTFLCLSMISIDSTGKRIHVTNAGLPYPLHYKAANKTIGSIAIDAFPLGLRSGSTYIWNAVDVEPGDRIILYTDGLIEIEDEAGTIYGFDGLERVLLDGCNAGYKPEKIIKEAFTSVSEFDAAIEQADDQTMVVIEFM